MASALADRTPLPGARANGTRWILRAITRLTPEEPTELDAAGAARSSVREVWALAGPAIAHMLLVTLVFLVDRILLGRYDERALASLQISGVLVWSLYAVFTSFSAGTVAVVGRSVGAGDRAGAAQASLGAIGFAMAIGVGVAAPLVAFPEVAVHLLFPAVPAEVAAMAAAYLRIVGLALPLAFAEAIAAASLQAAGDTRTPLFAAVLGNALNLALSGCLIFGLAGCPELGVRGAAIGTAAAMALQGAVLLHVLFGPRSELPLRAALASSSREALRRVLHVSGPAFAEKIVYQGAYLAFVGMIGALGATAMAANQALVSIEAVCFLSAEGFGVAAASLVAQKLGARRAADASRVALVAAGMSIALLSACGLVFAIAPRLLMSAFSDEPGIVEAGASALYVVAAVQPFMAFAMVIRMGLRGAGATRAVLALTLLGALFVRLPATWLFALHLDLGLVGVWIGSSLDWVVQAVACAYLFFRGDWKRATV